MRLTPEYKQHLQDLLDLCVGNIFLNDYNYGEVTANASGGLQDMLDHIKAHRDIPFEITYDHLCDEDYVTQFAADLRSVSFA